MAESKLTKLELRIINSSVGRKLLLATIAIFVFGAVATQLRAQSSPGLAPAGQSPAPQWQTDAGASKHAFDVASVKRNTSGPPPSFNHPTSSGDIPTLSVPLGLKDDAPTDGLFTATNLTLLNYMVFAYKITGNEVQFLRPQLPNWADADGFDIHARAEGNPTKDQMRLMMQSLLADRFKLATHYETRQLPILAIVLVKPGETGPQLRPHSNDPPCTDQPSSGRGTTGEFAGRFPNVCGDIVRMDTSAPGRVRYGARNVNMAQIESTLAGFGNLDRSLEHPLLDQTGLSGTFDFSFEWAVELGRRPGDSGPTFQEALNEQLGFKLHSQTGPVNVFVIDHVEEPSAN